MRSFGCSSRKDLELLRKPGILNDETVPNDDKLFSVFERHTSLAIPGLHRHTLSRLSLAGECADSEAGATHHKAA